MRVRADINEVVIEAVAALAGYAAKVYPDLGVNENELVSLMEIAREEVKGEKAYFLWDMYVVIGRKPL